MFRAVHTIKGTSSFLGFNALSALAHKAEDILGLARKGNMVPNHAVADALLEALDLIKDSPRRDKGERGRAERYRSDHRETGGLEKS